MTGIINTGIQEFVKTRYGAESWDLVKSLANCEVTSFAIYQDYPDEMTIALFKAASEACHLALDTVMVEFGKFIIANVLKKYYPTYLALAGSSPREFLLNADHVHKQVAKSFSTAVPPKIEYEKLPDGNLLIHYHSKRRLCAMLRGMILGVGTLFDQDLKVQEKQCVLKGASHCIMEVAFP